MNLLKPIPAGYNALSNYSCGLLTCLLSILSPLRKYLKWDLYLIELMIIKTGKKVFNKYRKLNSEIQQELFAPEGFRGAVLDFIQRVIPFFRDDNYYNYRILKNHRELDLKITRDTNWLTNVDFRNVETNSLPFYQRAIAYFEYKNMVIQRRAQYVIIVLTITLLIMTSVELYLKFSS